MIALLISSIIAFCLYVGVLLIATGVPYSLSDGFYILNEKRDNLGRIFTLWCFVIAFSIMAVMASLSIGHWYKYLAYSGGFALVIVGSASLFRKEEKIAHFSGTVICAISAVLWMIFAGYWYFPIIALSIAFFPAVKSKKWVFWSEIALFFSTYSTLIFLLTSKNL